MYVIQLYSYIVDYTLMYVIHLLYYSNGTSFEEVSIMAINSTIIIIMIIY